MDAVKFLIEAERAWRTNPTCFKQMINLDGMKDDASYIVDRIQDFLEEHPHVTNQSEFLKNYPKARLECGFLSICPNEIFGDNKVSCKINCYSCQKEFWLSEI